VFSVKFSNDKVLLAELEEIKTLFNTANNDFGVFVDVLEKTHLVEKHRDQYHFAIDQLA
jgi:hypothetical protein